MKFSYAILACSTLIPFATAQNGNDKSPTVGHYIEFENGAAAKISYKAFTVAQGQTLRALSAGLSGNTKFFNSRYIPRMLKGRMKFNSVVTLGGEMIEAGKYRFSFRIDDDQIWNLDLYSDTGKQTVGEDWDIEKGWWEQETKIVSIALDTRDTRKDKASRLQVLPVANSKSNAATGSLRVRFGPLVASVEMELGSPTKKATAEAAGTKSGE